MIVNKNKHCMTVWTA